MLYRTKNPHGGDVYEREITLDYSANTNPYGTPQGVIDAITESLSRIHQYPDPYCRALVKKISGHEDVPEEYILCGNGAADLIYSYCSAIGAKRALELAPTFAEYSLGLERTGCAVDRYTLTQENDFVIDKGFVSYIKETTPDVVFICNPNNPTGKLMDETLLADVLDTCRETGTRVFLDECFMDLTSCGNSVADKLSEYPGLLILKAFTKSYGMAGVRLGYCMSADSDLLGAMSSMSQPWNVSTVAQAAGVAALDEKEFLRETVSTIDTERAWLTEKLEDLGFYVCRGYANYILFKGKEGLVPLLKERGIAVRDCSNYHGLGKGWYRIAVRLRHQNEKLVEEMTKVTGDKNG